MDAVTDVDIDSSGKFKYVLLKLSVNASQQKLIVRGYERCEYHEDIYDETASNLSQLLKRFDLECIGGGRIEKNNNVKTILVYGYSVKYGKANHNVTCEILRKFYQDYEVTYSDEGY